MNAYRSIEQEAWTPTSRKSGAEYLGDFMPQEHEIELSKAISLKRIADALDKVMDRDGSIKTTTFSERAL